ncbi:hypothetical protein GGF46_001185 [Coemansia sp. RSA 552]|nr:hypothetical protein GGF46_001185 [Coemansia sp. RSA 552]
MSNWFGVSVAVPLGIGLCTTFAALRPGSADWHLRLRKPRYNAPHEALLPIFVLLFTLGGIGSYLVANEMTLAQHTPAPVAARAGQLGLGFYWLGLTFAAFWPRLMAFGPSLVLALADLGVGGMFYVLAMVQFFRLSILGGLLLLVCVGGIAGLATWNAALVQIEREGALPFWIRE